MTRLILGLGNPGVEYAQTRHNIGFMALDRLAERWGGRFHPEKKMKADCALLHPGQWGKVLLAKPNTFMNLSGEALSALRQFYKIELENVLIVYDDTALPLGKLRLRPEGSAGGHNGIKSIIQHSREPGNESGQRFPRLRLGIGAPLTPDGHPMILHDYVLGRFSVDDFDLLPKVLNAACAAIEDWLDLGMDPAMSRWNGVNLAPKPEPIPESVQKLLHPAASPTDGIA